MNEVENFGRVGYHDTEDTSALINWDYGTSVARVAIQALATLAGMHAVPVAPEEDGDGVAIASSIVAVIFVAVAAFAFYRWRRQKQIVASTNKYVGEYTSLITATRA